VGNFSFCHGDGGYADLLVLSADLLERPERRRQAEAPGNRAFDSFEDPECPGPAASRTREKLQTCCLGSAASAISFFASMIFRQSQPRCYRRRVRDSDHLATIHFVAVTMIGMAQGICCSISASTVEFVAPG
jgi:hypothetical protein